MRKTIFLVLPVLLFALVLIGCDSGGSSESWSNITSLNQINGTWSGSYSQTKSMREFTESLGETWDSSYQAIFGNMNVKVEAIMNMTVNSTTGTTSGTETEIMTFNGGNVATAWPILKASLSEPGVSFNDADHSATYTENFSGPVTLSDYNTVQINENGTKARIPVSKWGFTGSDYMILTKQ